MKIQNIFSNLHNNISNIWLRNTIYIIGVFILSLIVLSLNINTLSDFMFIEFWQHYCNNILIFILPIILINIIDYNNKWNFCGFSINNRTVFNIASGVLLAFIPLLVILFLIYFYTDNLLFDKIKFIILSENVFNMNLFYLFNDASVEELIFRGFIFQNLMRWKNPKIIALFSSVLFSIAHINNHISSFLYYINIFLAGILFCFMYIKTKSLWQQLFFHFIWNLLIIFIFNKIQFIYYSENILHKYSFYFSLLFGDNANFEAGFFCTLILVLLILGTTYKKITVNPNSFGKNCHK